MDGYSKQYKIIIIGNSGVGKSSIIKRFVFNEFERCTMTTMGMSNYSKVINLNEEMIKLNLFDTSGQERYQSIATTFYRGSHAALIVYDITNEESFQKVSYWIKQAKEYASEEICLLLIGNKLDLDCNRIVLQKDAVAISRENNMLYFEMSCLNSINIERTFNVLVELLNRNIIKTSVRDESILSNKATRISILSHSEVTKAKKNKKTCCKSS